MYIDKLGEFSDAQAVTADAQATNMVDLGAVTPKRQVGAGQPLRVFFSVDVAADFTTTDETYTFQILTSGVSAFNDTPVVLASRTIPAATLVAGYVFQMTVPTEGVKRYLSTYYDVGGTTPSITISAWLTDEELPSHVTYASGTNQTV